MKIASFSGKLIELTLSLNIFLVACLFIAWASKREDQYGLQRLPPLVDHIVDINQIIGHVHIITPFDYNYQNALGFAFLMLIRATVIFIPWEYKISIRKEKQTEFCYFCRQAMPS